MSQTYRGGIEGGLGSLPRLYNGLVDRKNGKNHGTNGQKYRKISSKKTQIPNKSNSLHQYRNTSNKKLRIGITGLAIESSTFSPAITTEKEFDIN